MTYGYKRLDGIDTASPQGQSAAFTGSARIKTALTYARDTGRVAHFTLGDSNTYKDEYGYSGGLLDALSGTVGCFGSGLVGAKHARSATSRTNTNFFPFNDNNNVANFVRNKLDFTGAVWTHATLTLTGTFTNFTGKSGDRLTITAGTNATLADYIVSTGNATTIVLTTTIGASATTGIAGSITPAAGTTSLSTIPQAFHDNWNIPSDWLPLGAALNYHASGNHGFTGNSHVHHKYRALIPANGPIINSIGHILFTSGANTAVNSIGQYDGSASLVTLSTLATSTINSTGTNGTLGWSRTTLAAGNRISGGIGTNNGREYLLCGTETALVNGAYCFLFSHGCAGAVTKGTSVSPFLCKGGESAYDIARTLNFLSNGTIDNFLKGLVDQCSVGAGGLGTRRAHCWIFTGFNDHDEGSTSLGPAPTLSYTAAGYVDNIEAIRLRLRARWVALYGANTADDELTFTIVPSHAVSDNPLSPIVPPVGINWEAREGRTVTYQTALTTYCQSRPDASAVNLRTLMAPLPFEHLYNSYYLFSNTGDTNVDDILHLNPAGYKFIMGRIITAALEP